jgi:hypothetical protein
MTHPMARDLRIAAGVVAATAVLSGPHDAAAIERALTPRGSQRTSRRSS